MSNIYAKYTSADDTHAVNFDLLANYTVTFNPNGGEIEDADAERIMEVGQSYGTLPLPKREGHTFNGWGSGLVPSEYQTVEYIETSGNAYIDTGITADIDYEYYIKACGVNDQWLLGARDDTYWGVNIMTDNFDFFGNSDATRLKYKDRDFSQTFEAHIKNRTLTISQNEKTLFSGNYVNADRKYGSALSLYVFGIHTDKHMDRPYANSGTRIYAVQIKDKDGNMIINLIPVMRLSDRKYGLFDMVSNSFLEKGQSGSDFSGGPIVNNGDSAINIDGEVISEEDIFSAPYDLTLNALWLKNYTVYLELSGGSMLYDSVEVPFGKPILEYLDEDPVKPGYTFMGWKMDSLPINYERLEYVSTNGTGYIDTGILPSIDYEYGVTAKCRSEDTFIMGARPEAYLGVNIMNVYVDFYSSVNNSTNRYNFKNNYSFNPSSVYSFCIKDKKLSIKQDGDTLFDSYSFNGMDPDADIPYSVYVFGVNNNGSANICRSGASIYEAYIKDIDGKELLNMIPCRKKKDDQSYVYGLYDTVSDRFLTCAGLSGDVGKEMTELVSEKTTVKENCRLYAIWEPAAD